MPAIDDIKSSWADEVELDQGELPAPSEIIENGHKIVTEYKYNNDDKKIKVVRTYKITKRAVPKVIAERKTWAKFGDSEHDKPGPNSHTTMVAEDVYMQFLSSKEEEKANDNILDQIKSEYKWVCFSCFNLTQIWLQALRGGDAFVGVLKFVCINLPLLFC